MSPVNAKFKSTEVGVIPSDWEVVCLGEMTIKVGSGITPTGGERVYKKDGRPFLRSQNVGWGCLLMEDIAFIDDSTHNTFKDTEILVNDVFLNITGASIGRSAVADSRVEGGNVNQHVCIIRTAKDKLYPYFLNYSLLSRVGQKQIDSFQAGGNRQGLNFGQIRSFKIPLPTKAEQNAIATVLSDADALISSLEKLIAKKRNIKQGAMQQLLTGKKRLPGFSGKWEVKKLGEIAHIDPENLGSDINPNYSFRYISLEDVDYGILRGDTEQIFCIAPSRARRKVRKGDVLVSTVRPNLKSHLLIKEDVVDTVCSTGFSVVRCKPALAYPAFIFAHLFTGSLERQIESFLTGSNYPAINSSDVKALRIPCPSPREQTAIAQVLSDMDAEIEALEKKLDKFRMIKQGMMQELLSGRTRLI